MPTVADIIDRIQRTFPNATDAECLESIQQVHDDICFRIKLAPSTQNITLVAGTASYALTTNTTRVFEVRYRTSATSYQKLKATHRDELGSTRNGWRDESGTPDSYLVEFGNITLIPNPSSSTSGSYPRVEVDLTTGNPGLQTSDTLPAGLPNYHAWIYGGKAKIAEDYFDSERNFNLPQMQKKYEMAVDQLFLQVQQMSAEYRPRIVPPGGFNSFRVRK